MALEPRVTKPTIGKTFLSHGKDWPPRSTPNKRNELPPSHPPPYRSWRDSRRLTGPPIYADGRVSDSGPRTEPIVAPRRAGALDVGLGSRRAQPKVSVAGRLHG